MKPIRRVLIIGIDGGTFDVFRPLAGRGRLPNLARLMRAGASGNLQSTMPPITGPAWRSFATGCNPGKHGVIDFVRLDPATHRVHVTEANTSHLPTLWSELGDAGKTVAVMGVPMTYPVQAVNGVLLTGMMTPPGSPNFSYPPALGQELQAHALRWPYSEGEQANAHSPGQYIQATILDMRTRVDTALYLLERDGPDFATFVFGATDPMQHQFIDAILDPNHPQHADLLRFYDELDVQIGRLLAWAGPEALVLVISDHGFGPLKGFIHLNNWLLEKGYLCLKRDPLTRFRLAIHRLGFTPENLYTLARRLGLDLRRKLNRGRVYSIGRWIFLSFENVDWEATRAYSLGHIGQVFISRHPALDEDGYRALRARLKADLEDLRHPETGARLVDRVFAREELYSGPAMKETPDLLIHPAGFEHVAFGESEFASNRVVGPALHRGHHRMEGMLVLHGPSIRPEHSLADRRIEDIMPTVLYALSVPVPSYLDGDIVADAFSPEYLSAHPPERVERPLPSLDPHGQRGYSAEEEALLRERLKDLGYLA